jgi:hypothetical protein
MARATKKKDEAQYAQPTSQLDLERRLESGNRSDRVLTTADSYEPDEEDTGRSFAVEGNELDNYIGTNPEYMTYANQTEAPLVADDSAEEQVADDFVAGMQQHGQAEESDEDEAAEEPVSEPSSTQQSSGA